MARLDLGDEDGAWLVLLDTFRSWHTRSYIESHIPLWEAMGISARLEEGTPLKAGLSGPHSE
jgi:hypothetical protein